MKLELLKKKKSLAAENHNLTICKLKYKLRFEIWQRSSLEIFTILFNGCFDLNYSLRDIRINKIFKNFTSILRLTKFCKGLNFTWKTKKKRRLKIDKRKTGNNLSFQNTNQALS